MLATGKISVMYSQLVECKRTSSSHIQDTFAAVNEPKEIVYGQDKDFSSMLVDLLTHANANKSMSASM